MKIKITADVVKRIRQMHIPYAVSYAKVAKEFGYSLWTIRDICTYRTRKNVK